MRALEILLESDSDIKMASQKMRMPLISMTFLLILGIVIVSIYFIYDGVAAYLGGSTNYTYQIMEGTLGFITSTYMMTHFMKRLGIRHRPTSPNIVTVIECRKCGFKQIRKFMKGDYILKSVENCQKCNEPMLITGIYSEEVKAN